MAVTVCIVLIEGLLCTFQKMNLFCDSNYKFSLFKIAGLIAVKVQCCSFSLSNVQASIEIFPSCFNCSWDC